MMKSDVLILDGGLGTTLEDIFHRDISTSLWSAKLIKDDPEVIISAHLAFLRSGADIILTSTYQCAYNTFERSGFSRDDAKCIMLKSVRLALEAKQRFLKERGECDDPFLSSDVRIALSLGPYGATLAPAQEFDGFYPPPFGPNLSHSSAATNAFGDTDDELAMENIAIDALTAFHYERLSVFADDKETWDALDFIAFETVPLRREIKAIRRAVTEVQKAKGTTGVKPWWISTVHPDGRYPEMKLDGGRAETVEVANAVLLGDEEVVPLGFGINCTGPNFLPRLLKDVRDVTIQHYQLHGRKPWLVLYPNRGDVYDPQTQTWRTNGREGFQWAEDLCTIAAEVRQSGVWEGIIVGGCCKTGPEEIAGLCSRCKSW